jgi:selenide,water dikinase
VDAGVFELLFDPQTSGGLLVAISPVHAEGAAALFRQAGVPAVVVGRVVPASSARIIIR